MVAAINPVTPVIAAESATADVVLQSGRVIGAKVMQILADDLVRIAVSSLSIEVASEVPLQVGQALQLAVSQTPDGIRLQIVPQDGEGVASAGVADVTDSVAVTQQSKNEPATVTRLLTPLEAAAVTQALQTASARQGGLSGLFANLSAAGQLNLLPADVQGAAASLLALRSPLNAQLNGQEIEAAFKRSGLFLEQSRASGGTGQPDLKAALVVLRQALGSWLGETLSENARPNSQAQPGLFAQQAQGRVQADVSASAVPLAPEIVMEEILLPGAVVLVADEVEDLGTWLNGARFSPGAAQAGDPSSLQEILQGFPKGVQDAVANRLVEDKLLPPPFRGAVPSAQSVDTSSIDDKMSSGALAHRLLNDTDAALARQTLLQIASLPDQTRADMLSRWNFEIPFVTPQGTAMAQFEISRDAKGSSSDTPDRVWRARFSLNLEPAGPVHAQVSLSGERTSVRMWAERPETVARMRSDVPKLSQALREAELTPGDIVIGSGAPSSAVPPNGHFVDREL